MAMLEWDKSGERYYETGVKNGVLYVKNAKSASGTGYDYGIAWNGLTAVTESPSGAEPTPLYADDIKYLNLMSNEEFGGTIEAYTYPNEFKACNGESQPIPGVTLGQQSRKEFGFSYITTVGNDTDGASHGYKIHIIYNALASVSEKAYATINDSPEAITFSWEFTTTAEDIGTIGGTKVKPTACITIDSTKCTTEAEKANLTKLKEALYGTGTAETGTQPYLPTPKQVYNLITTGTKDGTAG